MNKKACILGATGLVGSELLQILLNDESYDEVLVYTRKSLDISHPRLSVKVGNLTNEDFFKEPILVDHIFCCIGTTQSKTPDVSDYKQIDFGIPIHSAQAGLAGGMKKFLVVSSLGANADSQMFYPRVKGQMEDALRKMGIPHLHIFRPSMLLGNREEFRFGEAFGKVVMKVFGFLIPSKYKGIQASEVAEAMHKVANLDIANEVYESKEIKKLVS
ncbi:NAD(P)H-binding protein [Owenweeksia hongkongensis]|uniref:NAD(P)H-binding protein n=1 Tax=Owenweeksia hongkongensis TaxID=253245 RepID=UPI003A8E1391